MQHAALTSDAVLRDSAPEAAAHAAADIVIEAATPARLARLTAHWPDLVARADSANVFMHPVLLQLADEACGGRRLCTLLAWQGKPRRLVGLWAFAAGHAPQCVLPVSVLTAPAMPHAYLSAPVIDRAHLDAVIEAMLAHIAADANLPKIVALDAVNTGSATMQALTRALQSRGACARTFSTAARPMLTSSLDGKAYLEQVLSSSTRKKLRQHRRRLAEKGALKFVTLTEPLTVAGAVEDFLALEASGWKGKRGTAMLSHPADAHFARSMIATLAAAGEAFVYSLNLDGRPVSMQIVLRTGRTAFTWKTAYDEAYADFSPGMLLFEDYTAAMLGDPSIDTVDSCAFDESGYMAAWGERSPIAHLWFDARRGGAPEFAMWSRLQAAYLAVRAQAKAIRHRFGQP